jgi:hypothetical protein
MACKNLLLLRERKEHENQKVKRKKTQTGQAAQQMK